ncbi:unnamed protein product [Alopecurus aequalis]
MELNIGPLVSGLGLVNSLPSRIVTSSVFLAAGRVLNAARSIIGMSGSKNRHRPPAIAASCSGDMAPPWSSLPMDLVQLVGWRVLAGDLLDYVRFRAVCTDWRSGTVCPLGHGIVDARFHPRPWMLLPEVHGLHPADGKKRFFNLSTGSFVRGRLPLLTDHYVLVPVEGILLLQPRSRDAATPLLVLHPFTGDIVKLPPLMPLLESYSAMYPSVGRYPWVPLKFVAFLSVSEDGTTAVMIVHEHIKCVFFTTTKDKQWGVSDWNLTPLSAPLSFQGKLYILEPPATFNSGQPILQLDPPCHEHAMMPSSLMPPTLIAACPVAKYPRFFELAKCDSEILAIGFEGIDKPVVYKVADLAMGKCTSVAGIGGNTIFLDVRKSTSIQNGDIHILRSMTSSYKAIPTITSDTIVNLSLHYPWQYHLDTGKWSPIMGGCANASCKMVAVDGCKCGLIYHI